MGGCASVLLIRTLLLLSVAVHPSIGRGGVRVVVGIISASVGKHVVVGISGVSGETGGNLRYGVVVVVGVDYRTAVLLFLLLLL